ncbi:aldehyde dehydrogenase (NADP(+)) [Streptomyces sp. NPDC056227]|uniref:aldehyde dehydrogenase (NADP(+)) n=1 Tax=unclassified Streptomyces TaxID=2593676 RepID=UPI0035DA9272
MITVSHNPRDDSVLGTGPAELAAILAAAAAAGPVLAATTATRRGEWIRAVADALDANTEALVDFADQETALGRPRLPSELARTTGQLRYLAAYAESGAPFEPTIDTADPAASPTPRPDLRSIRTGIGVVLVFTASNFPFAFGVAGGDTASAWAAGCPVIVKAHPAHPLLSDAIAEIIRDTLAQRGAPSGMFGLLHGVDPAVFALRSPAVAAGAFTGSETGGRALHDIAAGRERPIPFFAEMGSVNPVVITESASTERPAALAQGLCESFLLGAGQFCTKPGLIMVPGDSAVPRLLTALVADRPAPTMLDKSIRDRHRTGIARLLSRPAVDVVGTGLAAHPTGAGEQISIASVAAREVLAAPELIEERFGPSTLFVSYESPAELRMLLDLLPGSLTGAVHRGAGEDVRDLVGALAVRAGRVLVDDWPTGVAVTWAQVHGGPYPATTDARHTAVGAGAISRFLRPVAYQNAPDDVLPEWLRDANPDGVLRRVNGALTVEEAKR